MPDPLVVDASVILDFAFGEGDPTKVARVIDLVAERGGVVPQHWRLEVANAIATRLRTRRLESGEASGMLERLDAFALEIDENTGANAWSDTLRLAARHRLTAYDAAYLELALRRRLPLATFDQDLASAARRENVSLLI